jgi:hypothetical protein
MTAFQLGLPSNIPLENCDTRSPRNLLDSDFGPDSTELPPSRPENESTQLLWFIVKDRLLPSFSKVCQAALSLRHQSEEDVRVLDEEIRLAHRTVPDVLQHRSITESFQDTRFLVMARFYIELLHLKSICVLHRRYMARRNIYSTHKCVDAGLAIVRMVIDAYKEFSPGGQLYEVRWMWNSYYNSDYLLGVIVVCLYVNLCRQNGVSKDLPAIGAGSEIFTLLEQSHVICIDKSSASKDAEKVSLAIRLALEDCRKPASNQSQTSQANAELFAQTAWNQGPSTDDGRQNGLTSFGALDPFNFMSVEPLDFDSMFASAGPEICDEDVLPPHHG